MPSRIQLSRRRGWRMPAGAVKVDRTSPWGNPFRVEAMEDGKFAVVYVFADRAREEPREVLADRPRALLRAVRLHRDWLLREDAEFLRRRVREELKGKDLACWCAPGSECHADTLLEVANAVA